MYTPDVLKRCVQCMVDRGELLNGLAQVGHLCEDSCGGGGGGRGGGAWVGGDELLDAGLVLVANVLKAALAAKH